MCFNHHHHVLPSLTWDICTWAHSRPGSRQTVPCGPRTRPGRSAVCRVPTSSRRTVPGAAVRCCSVVDRRGSTAPGCRPSSRPKCAADSSEPPVFGPLSRPRNRSCVPSLNSYGTDVESKRKVQQVSQARFFSSRRCDEKLNDHLITFELASMLPSEEACCSPVIKQKETKERLLTRSHSRNTRLN